MTNAGVSRALVYAFVSSEEVGVLNCSDQYAEALSWALNHGDPVYATMGSYSDEDVPARVPFEQRVGAQRLLSELRGGKYAAVLVSSLDRLGNSSDLSARAIKVVEAAGAEVVPISTTHDETVTR